MSVSPASSLDFGMMVPGKNHDCPLSASRPLAARTPRGHTTFTGTTYGHISSLSAELAHHGVVGFEVPPVPGASTPHLVLAINLLRRRIVGLSASSLRRCQLSLRYTPLPLFISSFRFVFAFVLLVSQSMSSDPLFLI